MISGLILAAGESSRMKRDKALLTHRGRTFLETIVSTLRESGIDRIAVVLGGNAESVKKATKLDGIQFVVNTEWRQGQTSSLQAGIRELEGLDLEAVLLALVDHPLVTVATIQALVTAFRETSASLVIPVQELQHGHPVVISRALFPDILSLKSDEGANVIARKYRDTTHFLDVDDPGVLLDIDDPASYERLQTL